MSKLCKQRRNTYLANNLLAAQVASGNTSSHLEDVGHLVTRTVISTREQASKH